MIVLTVPSLTAARCARQDLSDDQGLGIWPIPERLDFNGGLMGFYGGLYNGIEGDLMGFYGGSICLMGSSGIYPLVNIYMTMENHHVNG